MRYLCLVYGTEDSLPVMQNPKLMSRAEVDALTQDSLAYNDMLRTSGHFILAHALQSVRTATTVRVRGGQVLVTDGPFVETKEQLMHRSRVLAEKGRDGNMDEMLAWYKEQDAEVYDPQRPELKTYANRDVPKHYAEGLERSSVEIPAIDRHHVRSGK